MDVKMNDRTATDDDIRRTHRVAVYLGNHGTAMALKNEMEARGIKPLEPFSSPALFEFMKSKPTITAAEYEELRRYVKEG